MNRLLTAALCCVLLALALPAAASAGTGVAPAPQVALGSAHSCALADSGDVYCWDAVNTQPVKVAGLVKVKRIAASADGTCAVQEDGVVLCWSASAPTPTAVTGVEGAYDIVAGDAHFCALSWKVGTFCWGDNAAGQLAANGAKSVKTITASAQATCLRTHDSKLPVCRGAIAPLPEVADTWQLVAGGSHACLLSWSVPGVTCWGAGMPDLSSVAHVERLGASKNYSCAVAKTKLPPDPVAGKSYASDKPALQCWGAGNAPAPVPLDQVAELSTSSSAQQSCAIVRGGDLHCWAEGTASPQRVSGLALVNGPQYPANKWMEITSKLAGKGRNWKVSTRLHLQPSPFVFLENACAGSVKAEIFYWKKVRKPRGKKAAAAKSDGYEQHRVGVRTSAKLRRVGDFCKADFKHKVSKKRFGKQRKQLLVRAIGPGNAKISAFESGEKPLKDFKPPKPPSKPKAK